MIGYAKTLSLEVARYNINVNTICPGYIDTQRLREGVRRRRQADPAGHAPRARDRSADGPHRHGRATSPASSRCWSRRAAATSPAPRSRSMAACCAPFVEGGRHGLRQYDAPGTCREIPRAEHWLHKTFFDILAARATAHPDRDAIKDRQGTTTYGALKDQVERAAQFLSLDRHQTRRRRHHPAPQPHRLSDRLLRARIDRRHRQQGQSGLSRARARLHPEVLRQLGLRLPDRLEGISTTWAWRGTCQQASPN